ncbi:MAG: ThuA domain-containing protein [Bacteroidetes bacterium]|nr:ThuA domain-containing protein [Bacteroidota bacterium]
MRYRFFFISLLPCWLFAQSTRVLVNQVGYESLGPKRAVIEAVGHSDISAYELVNDSTGKVVYTGVPVFCGPVDKWKRWLFWTIDLSGYRTAGVYRLRVGAVCSHPFVIGSNVLEKATLSDIVYYFKGQRSAGLIDKADHHLLPGGGKDTLDLHGGWYDATGDYGKHLSHLSFSSYFNPQQIPLVEYSLLKTGELLAARPGGDFRQIMRRITDEAVYGADYLCRVHAKGGSFYRSVSAPGPGKLPGDRVVGPEQRSYRIKQSKDQSFAGDRIVDDWRGYQVSYRSGGGMAIAALAMAFSAGNSGDYSVGDYLKAAEEAFAFLEKENAAMTNDGKENILDDYCALSAATELYKATRNIVYKEAAGRRASRLLRRFAVWRNYDGYWRADDKGRPFFHPSDAGLPLVSLLYYYPYADEDTRLSIRAAVRRSLEYEMKITYEVTNPFGYSRQLVQDTLGNRWSAFFFPHGSEASPWWQGENARLGSIAAAARLAAPLFPNDQLFADSLQRFALDQLNWVLGLNPFDAGMLEGTGLHNPAYGFFGTFEYTNAPGGIVNGITSGLDDEHDIDLNLSYAVTGKDYDWRWAEQWLPHASWFMLAVAAREPVVAAPVAGSLRAEASPRFRVLALYENGGHHIDFSRRARVWLDRLAADSNFAVDYSNHADTMTESLLARYSLVIQLDYVPYGWRRETMTAFQDYIDQGRGGWIGFHHATLLGEFDGYPVWPWFSEFMGGIRWKSYIPQFASAIVHVEDHNHPVMKGIPDSFSVVKEEWYTYDKSPRSGVHVIASVDESSYRPDTVVKMGDHPVIWTNEGKRARNVYVFMGHSPVLFDEPVYRRIFSNAIFWAAEK